MELWHDTLAFTVKTLILLVLSVGALGLVTMMVFRPRRWRPRARLEVKRLNRRFESLADALRGGMLGGKQLNQILKSRPKPKPHRPGEPAVYVLEFQGDLLATAVERLREEITAITAVASDQDEVVLKLESGGGAVPHYGLAASQLQRLRDRKLKVTCCIDRVAASGGYMMAAVADQVIAAPFAIVGSVGVVTQIPNVHRLLKKHDIDFEEATAGEFKRTVTVFGEITEKGRKKLQEQLEDTHALFKDFVAAHRPQVAINEVATGEYWLGRRALDLKLVDRLMTSDEYLWGLAQTRPLFEVKYRPEHPWRSRLGAAAAEMVDRVVLKLLGRASDLNLR